MWKKKSIFWDLPYWKELEVRSSIDVMHVTKNLCMNLLLGNVVISKKFLRTRKIMVMHSNEREEYRPRTLVDRKRKRYDNTVDVFVRLHDPTDPSTESTAPPRSAHVRLGDVSRTLDPAECRGRASSARRRDTDDDEATGAGLRLSTTTI